MLELPRQSVGGGEFIQNRNGLRFPLWKTTAFEGELTCGEPLLDSVVVRRRCGVRAHFSLVPSCLVLSEFWVLSSDFRVEGVGR